METPSPDRDLSEIQIEAPNHGNETLTKDSTFVRESLGGNEVRPQLEEPSQISTAIQTWTKRFERKNNDRTE